MSANDYLTQVNGFATGLKTALGGNEQAAAELADKIITAEADIVAATGNTQENIQNAFNGIMKGNFTMLDNLQLGITPTKEGFQEVINKVNDYNASIGKASNYTIDNLADCQSALVDYVGMVGVSGYAAEEASSTIQGSVAGMKAAWQNMIAGMADDNADIGVLMGNFVDQVINVVNNVVPKLVQILPNLAAGIQLLVDSLSPTLPSIIETLLPPIIEGAIMLITSLVGCLPSIIDILISSLPLFIDGVLQIILGIVAALPELIIAITNCIPELLPQIIEGIVNLVFGIVQNLPAILEAIAIALLNILKGIWAAIKTLFTTLFNKGKEWIGEKVSGVVEKAREKFDAIKEKISNIWQSIKEGISNKIEAIKSNVQEKFNAVKEKITKPIEDAKQKVHEIIEKIKGFFKFEWNLPKLKMPHVKIDGEFSLIPPSVPKFSIDWYAKGGVFDNPTLFNNGGRLSGLGEAGAEAVVPLENNTQWLDKIAERLAAKDSNTPIILQVDGKTFARTSVSSINQLTKQQGYLGLQLI